MPPGPELADGLPELVVEDSPAAADLALLEERVASAACAAAGVAEEQEFAIIARDRDGQVVAGISAIVWGGYCELQAMWVVETLRNRGIAHSLIAGAEREARQRGCAFVAFHAYDLLAQALYTTLGYETVGVIEDCPAGSAARWYRKTL